MQLKSILHLTGELLQGPGEGPTDDGAEADALLPFAAVLSGAFSLVAPTQQASEAPALEGAAGGDDAPESPRQPLVHLGVEEIDLPEISGRSLDLAASATLQPAAEAGQEGVVLDQGKGPDGEGLPRTHPEPGVVRLHDASPLGISEEAPQSPRIRQDVEADGNRLVRSDTLTASEATPKPEAAPMMPAKQAAPVMPVEQDAPLTPAEQTARPSQEAEPQTDVSRYAPANDEVTSEQAEALRGQRQAERPSTQRAAEGRSAAAPKPETAPLTPAEQTARPSQEAEPQTDVSRYAPADGEVTSEQAEALRGQRQAERPSTQRATEGRSASTPTQATAEEKTSTMKRPAEPVSQVTVHNAEETVAAGATASEIDVAPPDLEGATQERTTGSSAEPEGNVATARAEGGDVSSDAGDDPEAGEHGKGWTRASRRSRRADAEPPVIQKAEGLSAEGARPQEGTSLEAAAATETAPVQPDATLALPDLDPGLSYSEEHIAQASVERTASEASAGRARAARGGLPQSRVVPAAWLRAVLGNARQSVFAEGGWKVLEMNLDEGDGTVIIKARREEGRVAVAVGFSDPGLRALASAHADRLQEVLQAEYETAVDFSLFSSDAGHSGERQEAEGTDAPNSVAAHTGGEGDLRDDRPARRPLPAGTQHEWVG